MNLQDIHQQRELLAAIKIWLVLLGKLGLVFVGVKLGVAN